MGGSMVMKRWMKRKKGRSCRVLNILVVHTSHTYKILTTHKYLHIVHLLELVLWETDSEVQLGLFHQHSTAAAVQLEQDL